MPKVTPLWQTWRPWKSLENNPLKNLVAWNKKCGVFKLNTSKPDNTQYTRNKIALSVIGGGGLEEGGHLGNKLRFPSEIWEVNAIRTKDMRWELSGIGGAFLQHQDSEFFSSAKGVL